jgi:hypothetical protein
MQIVHGEIIWANLVRPTGPKGFDAPTNFTGQGLGIDSIVETTNFLAQTRSEILILAILHYKMHEWPAPC